MLHPAALKFPFTKPSIGRIVIVKGMVSNGNDEHPAIVNCVHSADDEKALCNLTIFPDCRQPIPVTSIHVFETQEQGREWQKRHVADPAINLYYAFWPPRI